MTAEIGLLNKSAVVIAADSAATIGTGRVYNNANKIYELKNCKHVGIMIYNNSAIMEIPVETIIKLYSNDLDIRFRTLKEYADHFVNYLSNFLLKHVTKKQIEDDIENLVYLILESFNDSVVESINEGVHNPRKTKNIDKIISEIYNEITSYILEDLKKSNIQAELKNYSLKTFKKDYKHIINPIIENHKHYHNLNLDPSIDEKIFEILYIESIKEVNVNDDFTGIIFAGFGEDEIYPGYVELIVNGIFNDKLRWSIKKLSNIDNETTVIVRPFAQRDMSEAFFEGISDDLYYKMLEKLGEEYSKIDDFFTKKFKISQKRKDEVRDFLRNSHAHFHDEISKIKREEYINPIVETINSFRKDDLIEIAESLISITSLKRKTSSQVQSVGGPVDIAVITKGEGFNWIKAKHLKIK